MQRRRARLQHLDAADVLQAVLMPREDQADRPQRPLADGILREADSLLARSHLMLYTSRMLIDYGGTALGIQQGIAAAEIGLEKTARKLAQAAFMITLDEQEEEVNAFLAELQQLAQLQLQLQQQRVADGQAGAAAAAGGGEEHQGAAAADAAEPANQQEEQEEEGEGPAAPGEVPDAAAAAHADAADQEEQQDESDDTTEQAQEAVRLQFQAVGVQADAAADAAGAEAAARAAPQQQQHEDQQEEGEAEGGLIEDSANYHEVFVLLHAILRYQAGLAVPENMVPLLEDFVQEYLPPVQPGEEEWPIRRYPPWDAADQIPLGPPNAVPIGPHAAMYAGVLGMQRYGVAPLQQPPMQQPQRHEDDLQDTCSSATCVAVP